MTSKIALAAVAFCLLATAAVAYVLNGQTWPQSNVTMQLSLGSNQALIDGFSSFNQSAEDALGRWNQQLARLQFSVVRDSTVPPTDGDRRNSVFFSNSVFGSAFGRSTLAVTLRTFQGINMVEADVVFNSAKPFNSYRGPLRTASGGGTLHDLHRVAIHEFGHVLGLDHPDEQNQSVTAIMNSFESDVDALQQDDINGGQSLYGATAPTSTPTPTPSPTAAPLPNNLVNLSTRGFIGAGQSVLVGGFIVQGAQPTSFVVRALGPSLSANGVAAASVNPDPVLEVRDAAGNIVASNDDWEEKVATANALRANGLAPSDPRESALIADLGGGNYTAIVSGFNGATGVGLVELYDTHTSSARAANISTRDDVQTGDRVMIAGFIVGGDKAKQVILRAIGPSLTSGGISGALTDPMLELRDSGGVLVTANNDWRTGPDATAIESKGFAPANDRESAVLATLSPGSYTATITGRNGGTGIALAEIYDLSPAPTQ